MSSYSAHRKQASSSGENRLLRALSPGVAQAVVQTAELLRLKRGTILYEPEAKLTHCYFPLDGVISLLAILDDDRSAEVAVFGPESVVAYVGSMFGAEAFGRYVVQISGRVLRISAEALQSVIREEPELERRLRAFSIAFTRQTFQLLACNACHPVEQRCCKWLLTMADKARTDEVPITHDHLAQMLGVQRPTVSIITRELQAIGLIEQKRGCIRLLDRRRLLHCSCECYAEVRTIYNRWLPGTYPDGPPHPANSSISN